MPNYNKVILLGHLTRTPEAKAVGSNNVAKFGLATNRKFKGKDGNVNEETLFVDVEVWGKLADVCSKYLTRGSAALVEGRLKYEEWTDKESGNKRTKVFVVGDKVEFLGSKPIDGNKEVGEDDIQF